MSAGASCFLHNTLFECVTWFDCMTRMDWFMKCLHVLSCALISLVMLTFSGQLMAQEVVDKNESREDSGWRLHFAAGWPEMAHASLGYKVESGLQCDAGISGGTLGILVAYGWQLRVAQDMKTWGKWRLLAVGNVSSVSYFIPVIDCYGDECSSDGSAYGEFFDQRLRFAGVRLGVYRDIFKRSAFGVELGPQVIHCKGDACTGNPQKLRVGLAASARFTKSFGR